MPLVGPTGIFPCKKHRKVPVKLPLRPNLTPLVTITYLSLANLNSRVLDLSAINGTHDPKPQNRKKIMLNYAERYVSALQLHDAAHDVSLILTCGVTSIPRLKPILIL